MNGLRERFPSIKAEFGQMLAPVLEEIDLVRRGVVTADQLVDWMMRLMVSAFLLPHPDPDDMARGLSAVYRSLAVDHGRAAAPRPRTAHAAARRRPKRPRER